MAGRTTIAGAPDASDSAAPTAIPLTNEVFVAMGLSLLMRHLQVVTAFVRKIAGCKAERRACLTVEQPAPCQCSEELLRKLDQGYVSLPLESCARAPTRWRSLHVI